MLFLIKHRFENHTGKRKLFVRIVSLIAHEYNISHGRFANVLIRTCFVQKRKLKP